MTTTLEVMKVQGGDASSWKLGFRVSEGRPCKFKIFLKNSITQSYIIGVV
jgi:hypothetical protein